MRISTFSRFVIERPTRPAPRAPMTTLPEDLPPKWRENMKHRRACLFHYESDRSLSVARARSIALELIADNGKGEWDCGVVQLDAGGRDWEFRFKPHVPAAPRPRRGFVG